LATAPSGGNHPERCDVAKPAQQRDENQASGQQERDYATDHGSQKRTHQPDDAKLDAIDRLVYAGLSQIQRVQARWMRMKAVTPQLHQGAKPALVPA
jgi:hypothetical protein